MASPGVLTERIGVDVMTKRRGVLGFVGTVVGLVGVVGVAVAAAGDLPQTPVSTSNRFNDDIAASGPYLLWDQSPTASSLRSLVYLRKGPYKTRLNASRTRGYAGGIDGTTIIYRQVKNGQSDLRLYNATTKVHSSPPAGFNTSWWEYGPTISGNWILFGRESVPSYSRQQVILRNRVTGKQVMLANIVTKNANITFAVPGQVNGNWAVWDVCSPTKCVVYRRDIAAAKTSKLVNPTPALSQRYAPSVGANGTAYFAQSRPGCGNQVTLVKQPIGQPEAVLVHFKPGFDILSSFTTADPTSGTDYYFTKYGCRARSGQAFKVVAP